MTTTDPDLGLVAFQLVEHWGSRAVWRPVPRLEIALACLGIGSEPSALESRSSAAMALLELLGGGEPDLTALETLPRTSRLFGAERGAALLFLSGIAELGAAVLAGRDALIDFPDRDLRPVSLSLEARGPDLFSLYPWPLQGPQLDIQLPLSSRSPGRRIRLERRSPKR